MLAINEASHRPTWFVCSLIVFNPRRLKCLKWDEIQATDLGPREIFSPSEAGGIVTTWLMMMMMEQSENTGDMLVVVNMLASINTVNQHRAWLLFGWVTDR